MAGQGGTLTVRIGTVSRNTTVAATGVRRSITFENCRIVGGTKIAGVSLDNDAVSISVYQNLGELWPDQPAKIGALSVGDHPLWITLAAAPEAFAQYWRAAEAADGVTRNFHFAFEENDFGDALAVTEATLIEVMPQEVQFDEKTGRASVPIRQHPLIVELEKAKKEFGGAVRSIIVVIVVVVVIHYAWQWFSTG